MKCSVDKWWWLHNNVDVLNAPELYTRLKWKVLCYACFTTVLKTFFLKREIVSIKMCESFLVSTFPWRFTLHLHRTKGFSWKIFSQLNLMIFKKAEL